MEVTAKLRYLRQSPRKVRAVANLIRGLNVNEAIDQLTFINKKATLPIRKLVQSALANATHNFSLDPKNLYIKSIMVDNGPSLKRWRARAFGKAAQILKRSSHITVIVDEISPKPIPVKGDKIAKSESKKETKEPLKIVKSLDEIKESKKQEESTPINVPEGEKKKTKAPKKGFAPKIFSRKAG